MQERLASSLLAPRSFLEIIGARHNNLKNINVQIPLGTLTAVTGVSGSGKSSLVEDILYNQLAKTLHRASTVPGAHETIRGIEQINKVIRVDQQPLGNTPTSNPATYTGVFDLIRQLFSQLPECEASRLHRAAVQLQRAGRPLRGVRGQRPDVHPDALPARRVGRVRYVPRAALQPRRAGSALPRQEHRRRAGDVRAARPSSCSPTSRRSAASCKRCATSDSIISRSAKAPRRSPAAKRSA